MHRVKILMCCLFRRLIEIGHPDNVPEFIEKVKRKVSSSTIYRQRLSNSVSHSQEVLLSGFGHRIYRTSDPRGAIIRKTAEAVFAVTGKDALLETAERLHEMALKDDFFIKRRLYPNVDCELVSCPHVTESNLLIVGLFHASLVGIDLSRFVDWCIRQL